MDTYERQSLIDAIKVENFMKGDYVITEGDNGDKFYIVSEGTAIASKFISGAQKEVMQYRSG
jgi:cAMP-dependent protein kinase regulator